MVPIFILFMVITLIETSTLAASTDYGLNFCSVIENENVFGTQFHPEKVQNLEEKY